MKTKKNLKLIPLLILSCFALLFVFINVNTANAQCSFSYYMYCYGSCASGYRQVSSGGTRCCASGAWACGEYDGTNATCLSDNCRVQSWTACQNCVNCEPINGGGDDDGPPPCSPVNGVSGSCGSAHRTYRTSAPSGSSLCSRGSATAVSTSGDRYTWSCRGTSGSCGGSDGATVSCYAYRCVCPCDCPMPSCPSGTSGTNTGSACAVPPVRSACQGTCNYDACSIRSCTSSYRSCWVPENLSDAPDAPEYISMRIRSTDNSSRTWIRTHTRIGHLNENIHRVTYPRYGTDYAFGITNEPNMPRIGDIYDGRTSHSFDWQTPACNAPGCSSITLQGVRSAVYGQRPALQYRYTFMDETTSNLTRLWWSPGVEVFQGENYYVRAQSYSPNRCEGHTPGDDVVNRFQVNYIPTVESITIIPNPNDPEWGANPNLGVSGNIQYDASRYRINNANDPFDCTVDNPKYFEVIFRDENGCDDINPYAPIPSDTISGFRHTRLLRIHAVDNENNRTFGTSSLIGSSVQCLEDGKSLRAVFSIRFTGSESRHLTIMSTARDVLGNTSEWFTGPQWSYDANRPDTDININEVVSADELLLEWSTIDNVANLSGVRFVRTYARLNENERFSNPSYYGPIQYKKDASGEYVRTVNVHDPLGRFTRMLDELILTPSLARDEIGVTRTAINSVDIGINQLGTFDFRMVSVDRACNYAETTVSQELFSPWISTRAGLVHSDSIDLAIKRTEYPDIIEGITERYANMESDEKTTLSTELATTTHEVLFGFEPRPEDQFYSILGYHKMLNHPWFDRLHDRAKSSDEEYIDQWSFVEVGNTPNLARCTEEKPHIYFIEGDLHVNPLEYENLADGNLNGCLFIVQNNMTISEGEYKSEGVDPSADVYAPGYDLVRGYFIVDGEINIEFVDREKPVRDGLKVVGGLFATGAETEKSIRLGRSLQLKDNMKFPTLIVFHDSRYFDASRQILGSTLGGGYIRDVGFKE